MGSVHFFEKHNPYCIMSDKVAARLWGGAVPTPVSWRRVGFEFVIAPDPSGAAPIWLGEKRGVGRWKIVGNEGDLALGAVDGQAIFAIEWRAVPGRQTVVGAVPEHFTRQPKRGKLHRLDLLQAAQRVARGEALVDVAKELNISERQLARRLRREGVPDARRRPHSQARRARMAEGHKEKRELSERTLQRMRTLEDGLAAGLSLRQIAVRIGTSQPYVSYLKKKIAAAGIGAR